MIPGIDLLPRVIRQRHANNSLTSAARHQTKPPRLQSPLPRCTQVRLTQFQLPLPRGTGHRKTTPPPPMSGHEAAMPSSSRRRHARLLRYRAKRCVARWPPKHSLAVVVAGDSSPRPRDDLTRRGLHLETFWSHTRQPHELGFILVASDGFYPRATALVDLPVPVPLALMRHKHAPAGPPRVHRHRGCWRTEVEVAGALVVCQGKERGRGGAGEGRPAFLPLARCSILACKSVSKRVRRGRADAPE